ncbi:MAG TPA: condensation domain-containing protein, partial [Ktedonobacteraceae bacterium]|nr:condensation domain-containing protein [Ktedonobacteraceae bacterium]
MNDFSQRLQSLSPEKKALLVRELKKKGKQFNFFPLSFAQQRLWLLDQLEPGNPSYNISTAMRFTGYLHVAALERSLRTIVQRHESLRTTFATVQGQPVQVVTSSPKVSVPLIDLSGFDLSEREPEVQRQADRESLHSFDLARGPLLRIKLFRLSETEHVAVLNIHHIVSDGWSTTVLLRDLAVVYSAILAGQSPLLPPLPIQYADYAVWQRNWLQGEVLAEHLSYWGQQLGADLTGAHRQSRPEDEKRETAILNLPTDRPRPAIQTYRGNMETLTLASSLSQRLRDLSRREGVTLFMTLLAIFQTLLYRYSGQEDFIIGVPIANRNRADIEGLIGFFVNSLALRTDLSGNPSFHDLLMRVRETSLGAYAHQDLPFDKLVEEISPERNLSHTPLFQVYFNMINLPAYPT